MLTFGHFKISVVCVDFLFLIFKLEQNDGIFGAAVLDID
jgi:hypothetical protein